LTIESGGTLTADSLVAETFPVSVEERYVVVDV
jgi:hypothetical protein